MRLTKQRNIRQYLLFRDSSHMLSANRFRVYHSLQYQNGTCHLEIVLIRYLPTSSEFILHPPRISTSYTLGGYKWIVDFGKCILSLKNIFDAITIPLGLSYAATASGFLRYKGLACCSMIAKQLLRSICIIIGRAVLRR